MTCPPSSWAGGCRSWPGTAWEDCARENVAYLRTETGRHPDDPELAALVAELSTGSPQFRTWWAEHPVKDETCGTKRFDHRVVGRLELGYETLRVADDPTQALVVHAPEPGSPSEDALRLLLSWTAPEEASGVPGPGGR